ncbi:unnamed protein product [Callosobruchus maculatus]|uniref:Uncharacterized protein n=1 Tax=Callosobruchus maculatus TaxID=64391 RepID=A0A653DKD7_CALMS|nr:unnamed protein product [Callosobruchus maculatus]
MPMDAAERKRRSRARQREDPDKRKLLLEKEKERSMKRRMEAKRSQDEETKSLCREKERLRKQIYRNKLKAAKTDLKVNESTSSPIGSYKTKRTLKKAVNKVMEAMPVSPTKKEAVVRQLARNILPSLSLEIKNCKDPRSDTISKENVEVVRKFYELDEISRAAPGRKDTISIKDTVTGKRDHVAKRHMTMSVVEAYQLFKKDYPDIKVGKSKFFEFRPPHVRTMNDIPHNVCVCPQHANFNFMLETLKKCVERLPTADLLTAITCDINSEKCMLEDDCSGCFDITDILPVNLVTDIAVVWKKWEKSESQYIPVSRQGTLNDLIQEIKKQTPIFKRHVFVKRQQSLHFENKKKNSTALEVVLQVDFAENFSILCQDEIQSAHWSHPQVTIFTGCAWSDAGNAKHSYIIMSNELNHDKYAVWAFMRKIIDDLKQKYPEMKKVSVFF